MTTTKSPRSVICRSEAKKRVLETLARVRPALAHKLTRVSSDVYEHLDQVVNQSIYVLISTHPSVGKTICASTRTKETNQ